MLEFPRVRRFTGRSEEGAINAEPLRDILFAREEELLPSRMDVAQKTGLIRGNWSWL